MNKSSSPSLVWLFFVMKIKRRVELFPSHRIEAPAFIGTTPKWLNEWLEENWNFQFTIMMLFLQPTHILSKCGWVLLMASEEKVCNVAHVTRNTSIIHSLTCLSMLTLLLSFLYDLKGFSISLSDHLHIRYFVILLAILWLRMIDDMKMFGLQFNKSWATSQCILSLWGGIFACGLKIFIIHLIVIILCAN
jgi:hypothetical protein